MTYEKYTHSNAAAEVVAEMIIVISFICDLCSNVGDIGPVEVSVS